MALTGGVRQSLQQIYTGFRNAGLSHTEASNLAGVTYHESAQTGYTGSYGGQPTERGGVLNPGGAYGIAQFNGVRQGELASYANSVGQSPSDPQTQYNFIAQDARNRGIDLTSTRDIVNRYEVPRADLRAGEIANANRYAGQIDPNSYTGSGDASGNTPSNTGDASASTVNPNGTDSLDSALGSSDSQGLSLDGATLTPGTSASDFMGASNPMAGLAGVGGLISGFGGMLGLPPAVTGALNSALGLLGATGSIQSLANSATDSVATGGSNIVGFNGAGPVQANPELVSAVNSQSRTIQQGDRGIQQGVQTAGQTIGQAITTQSQSWESLFSDTFLRLAFIIAGLVIVAVALLYFARPQIEAAATKVAGAAKFIP